MLGVQVLGVWGLHVWSVEDSSWFRAYRAEGCGIWDLKIDWAELRKGLGFRA